MTQVITFQHNDHTFFVRAEQRDALNQALEANNLPKCEMNNPFEPKYDFEDKVKAQPDDNKVYVPSNYSSEDFDALLDQEDPRGYVRSGGGQSAPHSPKGDASSNTPETPIQKAQKQLDKVVEKLADIKYVAKDKESNLTSEVEKIKASFESQIEAFQDLITQEFLRESNLLNKLGKDLPAEDIDKIYFVHGNNPDINSKLSERRKEVVEFLSTRNKNSNEYKLALNFRIAKYKNEVAKFIRSYVNAHIRLVAKQNENAINEPVVEVRTKIDNSSQYKEQMEKVRQLKADRAVKRLEKQRDLERSRAMKQIAKAGIFAVLDNCVKQTREKLNLQFENAVAVTRSVMNELTDKIDGFNPKSNEEHYKLLVERVFEILEKDSDFKIQPIEKNSDNKVSKEEQVLELLIQESGGTVSPEIKNVMSRFGISLKAAPSATVIATPSEARDKLQTRAAREPASLSSHSPAGDGSSSFSGDGS